MAKIYSVREGTNDVQDAVEKTKDEFKSESEQTSTYKKSEKQKTLTIDFSVRLMLFVLGILALIFFGMQVVTVALFVFFGFVIMSSIRPVVNWLRKRKLSKGMSITVAYAMFFIMILSVMFLVAVPFFTQLAGLISTIPKWIEESLAVLEDFTIAGYTVNVDMITEYVADFAKSLSVADNVKNIATFLSEFFSWGAFLITSIIFSIYLVSEHDTFADILLIRIVSEEKRDRVRKLVKDIESKLGGWVLGQAVVSTTTAIYTGIVLTILGVPFALPLALFTGFIDIIPNLGSTLAGIIMSAVALVSVGPVNALILLVAFILYQPIENTFVVPKVMGNAVGLKPIIVLLGVIIFLIFFGIVGAFMAVPLMVISKILYEFYIDLQKLEAKGIV